MKVFAVMCDCFGEEFFVSTKPCGPINLQHVPEYNLDICEVQLGEKQFSVFLNKI